MSVNNKNVNLYYCCIVFLLIALSACTILPHEGNTNADSKPSFTRISASESTAPRWIVDLPEKTGSSIYFVGLSNVEKSEAAARKHALEYARSEFAEYVGVDIHKINTLLQNVYGDNLDVFSHSSRFVQEKVQASVSQIHAIKWYWEKYVDNTNESGGKYFKFWVLVDVPVDAYKRILAEKKVENIREKALVDKTVLQISTASAQQLNRAKILLEKYQIKNALSLLASEWLKLEKSISEFSAKSINYKTRIPDLRAVQDKISVNIGHIQQNLILDKGTVSHHYISSRGNDIPAWVFYRDNGKREPVSDLVLILSNEKGEIMSRSVTDRYGKAVFSSQVLNAGSYRIGINTESFLSQNNKNHLFNTFKSNQVVFQLTKSRDDLAGAVSKGLSMVLAQPLGNDKQLIMLASEMNLTRGGDDSLNTNFMNKIRRQIELEISEMNNFQLAPMSDPRSALRLNISFRKIDSTTEIDFRLANAGRNQIIASSGVSYGGFQPPKKNHTGTPWYKRWYTWATAGAIAAVILSACNGGGDGGDAGQGGSGGGCNF